MDRALVLAADVKELSELSTLAALANGVEGFVAVKIGCILGLRHGMRAAVQAVKSSSDLEVIYDHQKAGTDIPDMGKPFADVCAEAGVDKVIVFPHAGPVTLIGFVDALQERGLTPIVGLTMSHPQYLATEGGWIEDSAPRRILYGASARGVTDFVLPGNKVALTEQYSKRLEVLEGNEKRPPGTIWMPGLGKQGGQVSVACNAVAPHRARGIIGSAIYKSSNPREAMEKFSAELNA